MPEERWLYKSGNREKRAQAEDFPSGLYHRYVEDLVNFTSNSGTFVTTLTLSVTDIPAGNYLLNWSYLWDVTNLGTRIEIRVLLDGVQQGWSALNTGDVGTGIKNPGGGFDLIALDGDHDIELQCRVSAGGGSFTQFERRFSLERWD